ncbi:hypothetical protein XENORESO_005430 [Xenotaenia resolanae]|uniref:Uncharacterized protein n=1 Tax=Xenotaenia resolanae TaxID=208358 RepID=A0ABV0VSF6_9TELE
MSHCQDNDINTQTQSRTLSASLSSHTLAIPTCPRIQREGLPERQRGGGGHYLDETVLDTVAQANMNTALLSFNGNYTLKVHPELILFNTACIYIIMALCVCVIV